jgi:quercetin dioxygenase-like cupin family protein
MDGGSARRATYGARPEAGLHERIVGQRTPSEKRVLRAADRKWEGNVQLLVDEGNGFEDACIASFLRRLPPHSETDIHRHNFEAMGYVIRGSGYEIHDGERIDWAEGDVVFIPPNVWHQHVNPGDGEALVLFVTNWALMLNLNACTMEPAPSWDEAKQRPTVYVDPYLGGARIS